MAFVTIMPTMIVVLTLVVMAVRVGDIYNNTDVDGSRVHSDVTVNSCWFIEISSNIESDFDGSC